MIGRSGDPVIGRSGEQQAVSRQLSTFNERTARHTRL